MTRKHLTIIQLSIIVLSLVLGSWIGTQVSAEEAKYPAVFGKPLGFLSGWAIYAPWQLFVWTGNFAESFREELNLGFNSFYLFTLLGFLLSIPIGLLKGKSLIQGGSHGSADWGGEKLLRNEGLLGQDGVVLGRTESGELTVDTSDNHVFLCAPTRLGKGIGVVIPTLFKWKESVFVLDIKGENFRATANYRSKFSQVIYFNPQDPQSNHFNPLEEVRQGDCEIQDVRRIFNVITDPDRDKKKDIWLGSSRQLLEAVALHLLYAGKDKSIPGVADFIWDSSRTDVEMLTEMIQTPHLSNGEPHKFVSDTAAKVLGRTEKERSGILFSAQEAMSLFRDPVVARVMRKSDFRLNDLMQGDYPLSLYVAVPPNDLESWAPMIRVLINQTVQTACEDHSRKPKKRCLMVLDEFAALGRMPLFESQLAYVGGYGLKVMIIAQGLPQITKLYGRDQTILINLGIRLFYTTVDPESSEYVSKMLGTKTEVHQTMSTSGKRISIALQNMSVAEQRHGRALMTVDEILRLGLDKTILFLVGQKPLLLEKIRWFEDRDFKSFGTTELTWEAEKPCPYGPKVAMSDWALMGSRCLPVEGMYGSESDHMADGPSLSSDPLETLSPKNHHPVLLDSEEIIDDNLDEVSSDHPDQLSPGVRESSSSSPINLRRIQNEWVEFDEADDDYF